MPFPYFLNQSVPPAADPSSWMPEAAEPQRVDRRIRAAALALAFFAPSTDVPFFGTVFDANVRGRNAATYAQVAFVAPQQTSEQPSVTWPDRVDRALNAASLSASEVIPITPEPSPTPSGQVNPITPGGPWDDRQQDDVWFYYDKYGHPQFVSLKTNVEVPDIAVTVAMALCESTAAIPSIKLGASVPEIAVTVVVGDSDA